MLSPNEHLSSIHLFELPQAPSPRSAANHIQGAVKVVVIHCRPNHPTFTDFFEICELSKLATVLHKSGLFFHLNARVVSISCGALPEAYMERTKILNDFVKRLINSRVITTSPGQKSPGAILFNKNISIFPMCCLSFALFVFRCC